MTAFVLSKGPYIAEPMLCFYSTKRQHDGMSRAKPTYQAILQGIKVTGDSEVDDFNDLLQEG